MRREIELIYHDLSISSPSVCVTVFFFGTGRDQSSLSQFFPYISWIRPVYSAKPILRDFHEKK